MGLMTENATRLGLYPRLIVAGAARAIDFYAQALGATEISRYSDPTGKIAHAELAIGQAMLTLKDEDDADRAPTSLGGTSVILTLQVEDAFATGAMMERAGATVLYPIGDTPYGERQGRLVDPFGHAWTISQHIEDMSQEEIRDSIASQQDREV
jgi:uncharacterized glyoxalase superfamily protein PhnB